MKILKLSELLTIKNGQPHQAIPDGSIPVFGSGGLMRYCDKAIYDKESILLPRKGTLCNIQYTKDPFWTVDTLYYTEINKTKVVPYFLYYQLKMLDLSRLNSATGVPSMTFDSYYNIKIQLPNVQTQLRIANNITN